MKPAPLTYLRPESVGQALEQLAMADGDAKLLAGGQSLVPLLNLRMARPDVLVDIGDLSFGYWRATTSNDAAFCTSLTNSALSPSESLPRFARAVSTTPAYEAFPLNFESRSKRPNSATADANAKSRLRDTTASGTTRVINLLVDPSGSL